jgi:flavin-dependent dehydrogenase
VNATADAGAAVDVIDVAIAGGGPAGLAAAIRCAQRGFHTVCFERKPGLPDKACGEGLMPAGARELQALGIQIDGAPFRGIRYVQENGRAIDAPFRDGNGMGVRRLELSQALAAKARECGVELRRGSVQSAKAGKSSIELQTDTGPVAARLLIAADGLHSPLRRAAGLSLPARGPERFGVRRHFAVKPWSDFVEVYWNRGCEAYLTPIGEKSLNVAFLCGKGARFDELLKLFPQLEERLRDPESEARGAGPLLQRVRRRYAERLALVGDAAGYVDAITGQGLSLALKAATSLANVLPADLAQDLTPALKAYDRSLQAPWRRYALPARALVLLSRKPALRRLAIDAAAASGAFPALVALVK